MVDDITVGTVTNVGLEGWVPTLTLSLLPSVHLPANAVAKLGQTSLLGSKHVELAPPADQASEGVLKPGATIPIGRSHPYPETEDVLAATSLLLNGGGLQSFQTITTELNKALGGGRAQQARQLFTQLNDFAGGLDAQKNDMISALHGLDRFSATLAPRMGRIDAALQTLPAGLRTLDHEEPALRDAVTQLGHSTTSLAPFSSNGADQLRGTFHEIEPALHQLADTNHGSLVSALKQAPFLLFPVDWVPYLVRGDFANLQVTLDLTDEALDKAFFNGTPLYGAPSAVASLLKGKIPPVAGITNMTPLKDELSGKSGPLPNPVEGKRRNEKPALSNVVPKLGG
jgi:phospholipid/cholesterol/gamma-HCH transport system substrate-binding protein